MEVFTNLDVYRAIAEEAHAAMRLGLDQSATPKRNEEAGQVIRWSPDRRSFKDAMIVVVFAAMYLDALLYVELQRRLGRHEALKLDRKPHEERLKRLGVTDCDLLARVGLFRDARKDLVHEKAQLRAHLGEQPIRGAQDEAERAMSLLGELRQALAKAAPNADRAS